MGIAGAAIATVISQTTLTVYVIYAFIRRKDFAISLKLRRIKSEFALLRDSLKMGLPSFYVQILAAAVSLFLNSSLLRYGTDLDVAAVTIMSSVYSFYHMVVIGIVQGNNSICGYNWGARQYARVRKSLTLALFYSFLLSVFLFLIVMLFPQVLVGVFTDDKQLIQMTSAGIRYHLCMLPIIGPEAVSSHYFQVVGKSKLSSILAFFRYGIIIVPAILILAPLLGVKGIYISNAISDGIASAVAVIYIIYELIKLKKMSENCSVESVKSI
jgi:Na+-driven multidrug efflux pump